uniref:Uncharacterized protein n=1 Tax=Cacopsylla melanoneura TaxID=428564 RepID=A0A8D8M306_9HEMI
MMMLSDSFFNNDVYFLDSYAFAVQLCRHLHEYLFRYTSFFYNSRAYVGILLSVFGLYLRCILLPNIECVPNIYFLLHQEFVKEIKVSNTYSEYRSDIDEDMAFEKECLSRSENRNCPPILSNRSR